MIPPFKDAAGKYSYDHRGGFFRMGYDPGSGTVDSQSGVVTGQPERRGVGLPRPEDPSARRASRSTARAA
jgi:hypothetical protein